MIVSGFTFIRNAIKYDYQIVEAINSVLPLCNEFIVAVGQSDDETLRLIENINSAKIKIVHTLWDDSLREGGKVLREETNKAMDAISPDADWCFYIQGDECLHEKYIPIVWKAMEENLQEKKIEGLLFNYLHFYGSYDFVGTSKRWYRKEIRIIRNDKNIRSYRDAQGFRKDGKKLKVKAIDAFIYHYGWVKPPKAQQEKAKTFNKLWHDDNWIKQNIPEVDEFDYSNVDGVERFESQHPEVMRKRIETMNWKFKLDPTKNKLKLKYKISKWIENISGYRIGEYKNYRF